MDSKNWWQSRTFVLNLTAAILAGASAAVEVLMAAPGPITGGTLLFALWSVLQVWLRYDTTLPIQSITNNNSGPIAQVGGETFTGAATIGLIAGHDATNVTTSRGVTPTITPPTNGGGPEL